MVAVVEAPIGDVMVLVKRLSILQLQRPMRHLVGVILSDAAVQLSARELRPVVTCGLTFLRRKVADGYRCLRCAQQGEGVSR